MTFASKIDRFRLAFFNAIYNYQRIKCAPYERPIVYTVENQSQAIMLNKIITLYLIIL